MRSTALLAASLFLLVGCVDPRIVDREVNGEPLDVTRGANEYWMVLVTGSESSDPHPGAVCDVAWSHSVDTKARTVEYASGEHAPWNQVGPRPTTIIASTVWDPSDCPLHYGVTDAGHIVVRPDGGGEIKIRIDGDGTVWVDDQAIQPGQDITIHTEGRGEQDGRPATFTLEMTVEALGAWPRAGLHPVTD